MKHTYTIRLLKLTSLFLCCLAAPTSMLANEKPAPDIKSVEKWQFKGLKGTNTYFASHIDASKPGQVSEESRSSLRRAFTDNSSVPVLPKPLTVDDAFSNEFDVTLAWTNNSQQPSENPAGVAFFKFKNSLGEFEENYIVWRGEQTTSFVRVGTQSTIVYTIHHNVKREDGSLLLTLTLTRNSPLGVNAYTMSGSARLVK